MRLRTALLVAALACAGCQTTGQGTGDVKTEAAGASAAPPERSVYEMTHLRPSARPALSSDDANFWMTADRLERRVSTAGNLVLDESLNRYIKSIVCKLAGPYCNDIRVYVMRVPDFNATMMPNGAMQVWTGLLVRVKNEAQLAAVLGHEIGHFLRQHTTAKYKDAMNKTNALIFFQLALAAGGVPLVGDIAALGVIGSIQAYSRDAEREADDLGVKFLAENGYDPREAAEVWNRLIREIAADEDHDAPSLFFASHPASEERSETLKVVGEQAAKNAKDWEVGDFRFNAALKPLRARFLGDELKRRKFARFQELLNILREDGANLAEIEFFQGEFYRVRNDDGDLDNAETAYRKALKIGDPPNALYRSLGLVHRKLGKTAESRAAFAQYLEAEPNADDRLFIRQFLEPSS